jgi:hypothetical protein
MPVRVQRKRTKGWKMPPNTVSVTRPRKWGNPFDFRKAECCWLALSYGCRGDAAGRQEASVRAFREWIGPPAKGRKLVRLERGVSFGNDEKNFQIGAAHATRGLALDLPEPHSPAAPRRCGR